MTIVCAMLTYKRVQFLDKLGCTSICLRNISFYLQHLGVVRVSKLCRRVVDFLHDRHHVSYEDYHKIKITMEQEARVSICLEMNCPNLLWRHAWFVYVGYRVTKLHRKNRQKFILMKEFDIKWYEFHIKYVKVYTNIHDVWCYYRTSRFGFCDILTFSFELVLI